MLPTNLNTNEVKNASGTEIEFSRRSTSGMSVEFAANGESPSQPHRINVSHQEIGEGVNKRRRSLARVNYQVPGSVDSSRLVLHSAYVVLDVPVGNLDSYDDPKKVLAELISFLASTGADTTVKFDCTGTGAAALLNGTL